MKKIILQYGVYLMRIIDIIMIPVVFLSCLVMLFIRYAIHGFGSKYLPCSKKILIGIGVLPIVDHYYEPKFIYTKDELKKVERTLPGINLQIESQLELVKKFNYSDELEEIPEEYSNDLEFYYKNPNFGSGDAECLYSMIRHFKPQNIIEIGSGFSTLMARKAIEKNISLSDSYSCSHTCIEPFEMDWLNKLPSVNLIKDSVENLDRTLFSKLKSGDILFIDSSHIIRKGSDVLTEYLEILSILSKGVVVHIHDIYTPYDYPASVLDEKMLLWNEQYLLEAFLTLNDSYQIICSLNYLKNNHFDTLSSSFPVLTPDREPGSFWIQKTK